MHVGQFCGVGKLRMPRSFSPLVAYRKVDFFMIIQGRVLEIEPVSGGQGQEAYSYNRAYILDGREVVQARVGDRYGPITEGDDITAVCRVQPYIDRRGGGPKLSVSLVAPYAAASRAAA